MPMVEYSKRADSDGQLQIVVRVDGQFYTEIGPFETEQEFQVVLDDLIAMMRSLGAKDMPVRPQ